MPLYGVSVTNIYAVQADSEEQARDIVENNPTQARHIDMDWLVQKESN